MRRAPRGRPKGPIRARGEAREFFARADQLNLTLDAIREQLRDAGVSPPSYRALQDWRRGIHTPYFVPFRVWVDLLHSR